MKNYTKPDLYVEKISSQDILNGSDVLIDGSDLFGTESEGE